jgi:hypothetical protein
MDSIRRSELTRDVIKELANIFSMDYQKKYHPMRSDYLCDSWLANMHLCYSNDYISFKTLYEYEIADILFQYCDDITEVNWCRMVTDNLVELINSTAHLLGDITYEKLGIMLENTIVRAALA